jgi:hypothetical protein
MSATMGRKIQANSGTFFQNMSRPSGMLTSPNKIDTETATRLKNAWEENFGGGNIGRLAVAGDGLKYEAMTIPAEQAQLTSAEWSARDIAAASHACSKSAARSRRAAASKRPDQYYTTACRADRIGGTAWTKGWACAKRARIY